MEGSKCIDEYASFDSWLSYACIETESFPHLSYIYFAACVVSAILSIYFLKQSGQQLKRIVKPNEATKFDDTYCIFHCDIIRWVQGYILFSLIFLTI